MFLRNLFQHNVFTQQKRLVIQGPKGKAKTFVFGGIQQLRGQNFAIFWPPPPWVDSFYTLSVEKNRHFLTPSPLILST